jgi:PST family polysaccharide transporter
MTLTQSATSATLLWVTSSWRPRVRPDRATINELWGFSSRLTGFNAINYWARNADNLLIGRFIGVNSLAYYNRAYTVMSLPGEIAASVTTPVLYPALSRIKDDRERVKRVYLRSIGLIALVMFPVSVGLLVVAEPFILTFYGRQWTPAISILQILSIVSLVQTIGRTTGWLFLSQGRADWLFRWGIFSSVTAIASFFIGLPWGVHGVAIAYTIWALLGAYPLLRVSGRLVDLRTMEVLRAMAGVSLATALMGICVWLVEQGLPTAWSEPAKLVVGVATGILAYLLALVILSPRPYKDARAMLADYRRQRTEPSLGTT